MKQELTKLGYRVHEANVGAFSSNYDRAVELYYYIKGGRVDYGAACCKIWSQTLWQNI